MSEAEWYDCKKTKKGLDCLMNGCKVCDISKAWCDVHDKPVSVVPGIKGHCKSCGQYILSDRDTKGIGG